MWSDDSDSDTSKLHTQGIASRARSDSSSDEDTPSRSHERASSACVIRPSIGFHLDQNQSRTSFGSEAHVTLPPSNAFSTSASVLPSKIFVRGPSAPSPFNSAGTSRSIFNGRPLPSEQRSATDPKSTSKTEGDSNQKTNIQNQGQTQQSSTVSPGDVLLQSHLQSSENQKDSSNGSEAPGQSQSTDLRSASEQRLSTPEESQANAVTSSGTVQETSNAGIQAVAPYAVPAMARSVPISLHSFSSPEALAYPGPPSLHAQPLSSHSSQDAAKASASSLPPTFSNKCGGGDPGPSTIHSSDGSDESDISNTSKAGAKAAKKRRLKKDEERKRGTWRVQLDSATSVNEQSFSTLPGKPVFTIHQPILEETPLPYFEYKEAKSRPRKTITTQPVQQEAGPSDASPSASNAHDPVTVHNFEDDFDAFSAAYPLEVETDMSISAGDLHQACHSGIGNSSQLPVPTAQARGTESTSYTSMALLGQEASSHTEDHLISVIIEDTRFTDREPSFVELVVPLRPDGNGAYWLDAAILCNTLQSGPSRIDGPAKAYVFRDKYRQYFLRVSAENTDIYGPANLSVPAGLVLKVMVEAQTVQTAGGLVTDLLPQINARDSAVRLPSSTPTEDRFPKPNGPLSRPALLVKRGREQLSPERPRNDIGSGATAPFAGQQDAPVSGETPRRSYYRKRAL